MSASKRFKYLNGSSILESVIAIAITSICILVAFTIYINVVKRNDPIAYYDAKQKVELLTRNVMEQEDYENDSYGYDNYTIVKEVELRETEKTVLLKWTIKTANKAYDVKKIIPYGQE